MRIRFLVSLFIIGLFTCATTNAAWAQDDDKTEAPEDTTKTKIDEKKDLPLPADRRLQYTATEGSWISLDVSPDGKTILASRASPSGSPVTSAGIA